MKTLMFWLQKLSENKLALHRMNFYKFLLIKLRLEADFLKF